MCLRPAPTPTAISLESTSYSEEVPTEMFQATPAYPIIAMHTGAVPAARTLQRFGVDMKRLSTIGNPTRRLWSPRRSFTLGADGSLRYDAAADPRFGGQASVE